MRIIFLVLAVSLVFVVAFPAAADDEPPEVVDVFFDSGNPYLVSIDNLLLQQQDLLSLLSVDDNIYPSNAPLTGGVYVSARTNLGQTLLYVPTSAQYRSFALNAADQLVNITASTITGVAYVGSTVYTVRATSFGTFQYRSLSNSSYYDLTFSQYDGTNIAIADSLDALPLMPVSDVYFPIFLFLVGGCLLCLLLRR